MSDYTFRLAAPADKEDIVAFMNTHWGSRHPLINLPDYFCYYYQNGQSNPATVNFVLCLQQGQIAAVCGFIPTSENGQDIWISIWCADKKAKGSGLELMAQMLPLTGAKRMSCNNIRPNTIPFYEFLGYTGARMGHFYRLAPRPVYHVAQIKNATILPVSGNGSLRWFATFDELAAAFTPPATAKPYKDAWYLKRRYFAYPRQSYIAMGGFLDDRCTLVFFLRDVLVGDTHVLRLVDIVGDYDTLPQYGVALDALLGAYEAEYIDCYCHGLSAQSMAGAGFSERAEADDIIIPHYLAPPLIENVEYYFFTSDDDGFVMFRADGDQDRPNIQC